MTAAAPPVHTNAMVKAIAVGVALGLIAQVLRQVPGQTMQFGAATAPWLSIGFALAVWAVRLRAPGRVLIGYLMAWLVAYHLLFALGQSVALSAAFREALPWLILALPVCLVLARVATLATASGAIADLCLAVPIAWSVPETLENVQRGDIVVAAAIALLAFLPLAASQRRDIRLLTFVIGAVILGGLAVLVGPVVRGQIHS